jgi:hypothetical protein
MSREAMYVIDCGYTLTASKMRQVQTITYK